MSNKDMTKCGIYGFYNTQTDECLYIGMSKDIESRVKKHILLLKSGKHRRADFSEWYKEYYNQKFLEVRILELSEENFLSQRERFWFEKEKPKFFGQSPTGENEYFSPTEETKKKISNTLTNKRKQVYSDLYKRIDTIHEYCSDASLSKKEVAELLGITTSRLARFISSEGIRFIPKDTGTYKNSKERMRKSASYEKLESCIELVLKYSSDRTLTQKETARLLGVSTKSLRLFLLKKHIAFSYANKVSIDRDALFNLYHIEGLSMREIAKRYGTTDITVLNRMKEHKIDRRDQAEATAISNKQRFGALSQQVLAPDC